MIRQDVENPETIKAASRHEEEQSNALEFVFKMAEG